MRLELMPTILTSLGSNRTHPLEGYLLKILLETLDRLPNFILVILLQGVMLLMSSSLIIFALALLLF